MGVLGIFEPEETVGNAWHRLVSRIGEEQSHSVAAVCLSDVQTRLAVLFRALGGAHHTEIVEAAATGVTHRRRLRRKLAQGTESIARPSFDGDKLRLPPVIQAYDDPALNLAAYRWLTASAALISVEPGELPPVDAAGDELDRAYLKLNQRVSLAVASACPGLRGSWQAMCRATLSQRQGEIGRSYLEQAIRNHLAGSTADIPEAVSRSTANRVPPIPFWLDFQPSSGAGPAAADSDSDGASAPAAAAAPGKRKLGLRRDLDQANRKDSFIMHRFESILSWAESMNINRTVQDDDDENAQKAADDQDNITLSKHDRKTATRLRLHLDLSPADAEHERLAGEFVYPEWNHRRQVYMADHCRVLEAPAVEPDDTLFELDRRAAERVRRQFEVLRTRRVMHNRQRDGAELDLDALVAAQADLVATGRGSDRIYINSRKAKRDLSVALLLDVSRSTESDLGGICVLDVAKNALSSMAHGLDACGDQFGIWAFSSRRRDRVFVTRCKGFAEPMSAGVDRRLAGLKAGHYTRLGAAIRHVSDLVQQQPSAQRMLLVLTDGKPNDLDHYEGKQGIEDSRMAVRDARRAGVSVHGVIIDEDGQDWFARIFERSGFTLLPHPRRLPAALPEIYQSLTREL